MRPHLLSPEEMDDVSTIVRIHESENQWTQEAGQIDVPPADELADPGLRGKFETTLATSAEFALDVSRAFIIDIERGVGDTAQGIGEAQGFGETAQGIGEAQDVDVTDDVATSIDDSFSVTESVGEYEGAFSANDSDGTDVNDCLDSGYRVVDSYPWPAVCDVRGVRLLPRVNYCSV